MCRACGSSENEVNTLEFWMAINVTAFYPNPGQVDPPAHELPVGLVDAEALRIGGQRGAAGSRSLPWTHLLFSTVYHSHGGERKAGAGRPFSIGTGILPVFLLFV